MGIENFCVDFSFNFHGSKEVILYKGFTLTGSFQLGYKGVKHYIWMLFLLQRSAKGDQGHLLYLALHVGVGASYVFVLKAVWLVVWEAGRAPDPLSDMPACIL